MTTALQDMKVAILATDGFEHSELMIPKQALEAAGAKTEIVSLKSGTIRSWKDHNWGEAVTVDRLVAQASVDDYDALLLPGGVMNPDLLRVNIAAVALIRGFVDAGKTVAAICHAPWLLIEAGVVDGRKVTSWPSLRTDLENAGASWHDAEVVTDQGLVTSRKPDDLPAFTRKMIEEIIEGVHTRMAV